MSGHLMPAAEATGTLTTAHLGRKAAWEAEQSNRQCQGRASSPCIPPPRQPPRSPRRGVRCSGGVQVPSHARTSPAYPPFKMERGTEQGFCTACTLDPNTRLEHGLDPRLASRDLPTQEDPGPQPSSQDLSLPAKKTQGLNLPAKKTQGLNLPASCKHTIINQ